MSQPGMPPGGPGQPYGPGHFPPGSYTSPFPRRHPDPETRRDVEAAWQARLELGLDFEEHIAAGLAERVEELAHARTAELVRQTEAARVARLTESSGGARQLALGIVSVVMGVPITAITLGVSDSVMAMTIAWAGMVGVNVAHAVSLRRGRAERLDGGGADRR